MRLLQQRGAIHSLKCVAFFLAGFPSFLAGLVDVSTISQVGRLSRKNTFQNGPQKGLDSWLKKWCGRGDMFRQFLSVQSERRRK